MYLEPLDLAVAQFFTKLHEFPPGRVKLFLRLSPAGIAIDTCGQPFHYPQVSLFDQVHFEICFNISVEDLRAAFVTDQAGARVIRPG